MCVTFSDQGCCLNIGFALDKARHGLGLYEDLTAHEALEPLLVELGLDSRQVLLVGAHQLRLDKLLTLLVAIPQLQEVNYRYMVALHAVLAGKAMSFEPCKLVPTTHHGYSTARVHHSVLHVLCIDLNLGFDA